MALTSRIAICSKGLLVFCSTKAETALKCPAPASAHAPPGSFQSSESPTHASAKIARLIDGLILGQISHKADFLRDLRHDRDGPQVYAF
jgi:hypothetical protein